MRESWAFWGLLWRTLREVKPWEDGIKFPIGRIWKGMSMLFSWYSRAYWVKSLFWSHPEEIACMHDEKPCLGARLCLHVLWVWGWLWHHVRVLDERDFRTLLPAPRDIHGGHRPQAGGQCSVWSGRLSGRTHGARTAPSNLPPQASHFVTLPNRDYGGLKALTFGPVLISGHLKLSQVNKI